MGRIKKLIKDINEAEGLGDIIKAGTTAIGIEPCDACEQRRKLLNDMFSFIKTARRELTQEEIDYITTIEETQRIPDTKKFVDLYNQIYGTAIVPCNCPGLHGQLLQKLSKQKEYDNDKNNNIK